MTTETDPLTYPRRGPYKTNEDRLDDILHIRCNAGDKEAWTEAADSCDPKMSLSAWCNWKLNL